MERIPHGKQTASRSVMLLRIKNGTFKKKYKRILTKKEIVSYILYFLNTNTNKLIYIKEFHINVNLSLNLVCFLQKKFIKFYIFSKCFFRKNEILNL